MGCDIHLHSEVEINGVWHHYCAHDVDRNYKLFALMAGVRGDCIPVAEPKGLPNDISLVTKLSYKQWEDDAHTASWLSSEEISTLENNVRAQLDMDLDHAIKSYFFSNSYGGFHKYPKERPEGIADLRFVFWFDN